MNSILEIATRVSTPLALGGLFAAILFLIFRQILSREVFPHLTQTVGGTVVLKILNRLFVLALIAMLLGFIGYVLPTITKAYYPQLDQGYVDVATDRDLTLEQITLAIASGRDVTIVFDSSCGNSIRNAIIEKGNHDGANLKDLLENLKQRVKGRSISYSVRPQGAKRYEIFCQ